MSASHPVWDVYNLLRTARLNEVYYIERMSPRKVWHRVFEITIAIAAPSSAVAGWFLWEDPIGKLGWQILSGVAAVFALLQPILRLTEDIQVHESVITQYADLKVELQSLRTRVSQEKCYSGEHKSRFRELDERRREVAKSEPPHKPNKERIRKAFEQTKQEMPSDKFFVPSR